MMDVDAGEIDDEVDDDVAIDDVSTIKDEADDVTMVDDESMVEDEVVLSEKRRKLQTSRYLAIRLTIQ